MTNRELIKSYCSSLPSVDHVERAKHNLQLLNGGIYDPSNNGFLGYPDVYGAKDYVGICSIPDECAKYVGSEKSDVCADCWKIALAGDTDE